jgi:ParB family chromosome partitioning protein
MAVADNHKHRDIAAAVDLPRARVSSLARTRKLPPTVRRLIDHGELSPRHGETLLKAPAVDREELAQRAKTFRWSVETLARKIKGAREGGQAADASPPPATVDPNVASLERDLSEQLACPVSIRAATGQPGGELVIRYFDNEQLEGILERFLPRDPW